jgi:hypothetical protein
MIPNCGEYAPKILTCSSLYRVQSRLYEPPHTGLGEFALVPVLEEKYHKQH